MSIETSIYGVDDCNLSFELVEIVLTTSSVQSKLDDKAMRISELTRQFMRFKLQ